MAKNIKHPNDCICPICQERKKVVYAKQYNAMMKRYEHTYEEQLRFTRQWYQDYRAGKIIMHPNGEWEYAN